MRLRYAPDLPLALDGLDLTIPDGGHLAILGPSGAGKSSLGRLLVRFWEYEGEIRLGGHDLRSYRPDDLRRIVGIATQDAQLFNASIRDNLLMAAPDAEAAAMDHALEVVQLSAFVRGLPDGIDTWIGEAGARLSAGQARRLVLARALLRDPRILILDEPTENLDAGTARRLLAALRAATAHRTVILITHDPRAAAAVHRRDRSNGGWAHRRMIRLADRWRHRWQRIESRQAACKAARSKRPSIGNIAVQPLRRRGVVLPMRERSTSVAPVVPATLKGRVIKALHARSASTSKP